MSTVPEGVETAEQAEVLATLLCDKAQVYFYARPLDAEAATLWQAMRAPAAPAQTCPAPVPRTEFAERLLPGLEASHVALALFDPHERLVSANQSFREVQWQGLDGTPSWDDIMRGPTAGAWACCWKTRTSTAGSATCASASASIHVAFSNPT